MERGAERREGVLPCAFMAIAVAPFALRDVDSLVSLNSLYSDHLYSRLGLVSTGVESLNTLDS